MIKFLEKVITEIKLDEIDLINTCFVLPNKRSSVHLKSILLERQKKTSFSPKICSIDEFIISISGLKEFDLEKQLLLLHETYLEKFVRTENSSFENFSDWALKFLKDVSEIEQNLLDPEKIFKELSEINKIQNWSEAHNIKIKRDQFWSSLPKLYQIFKKKLLDIDRGTKGICYCEASKNLEFYKAGNPNVKHFFIGLNALTISEELIIKELIDLNDGDVFWDIDKEFIKNKYHKSSYYINAYKKRWKRYNKKEFKWVLDDYRKQKKFHIISCPNFISQANQISASLNIIGAKNNVETAVILGDENLIAPYMYVNQQDQKNLDISVNQKLDLHDIIELINLIFSIHYDKTDFNEETFTRLQDNIFFKKHFKSYAFLTRPEKKIMLKIIDSKTKSIDMIKHLCHFFEHLCAKVSEKTTYQIKVKMCYEAIRSVKNLAYNFSSLTIKEVLLKTILKKLENIVVRYEHNKDGKIKIMGLLESRCLDFENVIISSVNEGILPKGKTFGSLLPYDLKKRYKLVTHEERDAMYTYHFYRLIKRAKNIFLIYNSSNNGILEKEKSRFVYQLELENAKDVTFYETNLKVENYKIQNKLIKSPATLDKLKDIAMKGFSPSSIEKYIKNPVDFYFSKLHNIKDHDDETDLSSRIIGVVFHEILELIYKPYVNKTLDQKNLLKIIQSIDDISKEVFLKNKLDFEIGKELVIFEVIKKSIYSIVKNEIQDVSQGAKIQIIALEKELNCLVDTKKWKFPVKVRGIVDRIDKRNGAIRIIDYKTGAIRSGELNLRDMDSVFDEQKTKSMQLLCYCLMFLKTHKKYKKIQAGLLCLRDIKKGFIKLSLKKQGKVSDFEIVKEEVSSFEKRLKVLISEILNPKTPFKTKD